MREQFSDRYDVPAPSVVQRYQTVRRSPFHTLDGSWAPTPAPLDVAKLAVPLQLAIDAADTIEARTRAAGPRGPCW